MKKNLKKILAFLCAVVLFVTAVFTENAMNQAQAETETSTQATSTEPKPVELYGFQNVTLNGLVGATDNSVMTDKEYTNGDAHYKSANATNFDKKLFTAWVEFTDSETDFNWWKNRICIGGTAGSGWGLSVAPSNNGESLMVCDADGEKIAAPQINESILASKVEVDSFLGAEFLLQMGFEYLDCDNDDEQNDVRILVYVNGKEGLNTIVKNCKMDTLGEYVRVSILNTSKIGINSVDLPIKPVELDGFTNVGVDDFTKFGTTEKMNETTYSNFTYDFELTGEENFNKKLFTAYVKPTSTDSGWWGWRICIGGTSGPWGLSLNMPSTGEKLVVAQHDSNVLSSNWIDTEISASKANLTSFTQEPFLLQMGLEYQTKDTTGENNDVRLLIYVNGNEIHDATYNNCNMNNLGNHLRFYVPAGSIEVSSFQSEAKPVTLSSHDTITISDFQDSAGNEMEAKGYDYDSVTPTSQFSLKDGSNSFNEKLLSMKVKFGHRNGVTPNWQNRLAIPAADGNSGIFVFVNNEDDTLHIHDEYNNDSDVNNPDHYQWITCDEAGVTSFKDNPFILQMSFKDTTNGLELDVYINGKLCGTYDWAEAKTSDYSSKLDLTRSLKDAFIVVSDADAEEFPADPAIMPDSSFEKITFGSFGIKDGTYSETMAGETYTESLDQKVLCGKVKFEISSWFTFRLGGKTSEWYGLYLNQGSDGNIDVTWKNEDETTTQVMDIEGNILKTFTSDKAKVDLLGEEYDLMISMEVTDQNGDSKNDVKLGVWFANKLYDNQYYYVYGCGDSLGNKFGFNMDANSKVTLNSVKEYLPQPDSNYERITFQHFLVEDGEYESKAAEWFIHNSFKKKDDLDKVIVCGDVQLNGGAGAYMLALGEKNADPYSGIFMYIKESNLTLSIASDSAYISSTDAGVGDTFVGNPFSLMWSVEFVDSVSDDGDTLMNDVKVQLWFDGYLCVDKTFVDGGTKEELGNTFAVCCPGEGDSITLNSSSKLLNLPGEEFGKLSLSDFEHNGTSATMESGTYVAGDQPSWLISGKAKGCKTLDKKVVSLDILQSGIAGNATTTGTTYQMRIGGAGGDWYGLALNTTNTGTIDIGWCRLDGTWAQVKDGSQFMSVDVNNAIYNNQPNVSSIVNETFNLMVSMEVVDADSNDVDDVKVRIWFNKIPFVYNGMDSFIYLDCGDSIGNIFTAGYITKNADEKAFVSLRTDAEYQSNPNYYEDITQFRQSTGYTYPEVEGKIFAGWYTDADYKTVLDWKKTEGSAYAKFVDDEVLRVKSQVALDANKKIPTDKTTLRFVTTVDSLMYKRVGFKYQVQGENGNYSNQLDSYNSYTGTYEPGKNPANMVYKTMYYVGNNDDTMSYEPDAFSWQSEYFKAWSLTDIKASQYHLNVKITPYWITKDGTLVLGEEREICVNDSPTEDTSASATIDFLGKNTMPIAGYGIWNNSDIFDMNGIDEKIFPDYDEEQYFEMFADAGINLINRGNEDYAINPSGALRQLENGTKYGLGVFVNDSKLLDITDATELSERLKEYSSNSKYESFSGLYLVDEPTTQDYGFAWSTLEGGEALYTNYKSTAELLNAEFENTEYLTYCNLFPIRDVESNFWQDIWSSSDITKADKDAYKEYVNTINTNLNSKVISYDYYPFEDTRIVGEKYDYNLYFWNMDLIRTTALSANNGKGKPFWAYVQVGSQWKDPKTQLGENDNAEDYTLIGGTYYKKGAFDSDYYPSESQFNWIVNTSLAFGAQGIQYFPLIQPIQFAYDSEKAEYDFEVNGVLSAWGGKTQWYYYAQEINKHIAEIDEVLMNAKTQKVVVPASGNAKTQTDGLSSVATSYGVLNGVTGDALVGYFNYGGKVALYVANNQHFAVGTDAKKQNVTLNLSNDYNEITMYDNAKKSVTATTSKQLTLTMDAGEGILLVLE